MWRERRVGNEDSVRRVLRKLEPQLCKFHQHKLVNAPDGVTTWLWVANAGLGDHRSVTKRAFASSTPWGEFTLRFYMEDGSEVELIDGALSFDEFVRVVDCHEGEACEDNYVELMADVEAGDPHAASWMRAMLGESVIPAGGLGAILDAIGDALATAAVEDTPEEQRN